MLMRGRSGSYGGLDERVRLQKLSGSPSLQADQSQRSETTGVVERRATAQRGLEKKRRIKRPERRKAEGAYDEARTGRGKLRTWRPLPPHPTGRALCSFGFLFAAVARRPGVLSTVSWTMVKKARRALRVAADSAAHGPPSRRPLSQNRLSLRPVPGSLRYR